MKDTSLKLSGPAMDRFFKRFLAEERALPDEAASRLLARCKLTFTSVRVRKAAHARLGRRVGASPGVEIAERIVGTPVAAPSPTPAPAPAVAAPAPAGEPVRPVGRSPAAVTAPSEAAFDPYVFGLVPVFQREGRDGLLARLGGIADTGQLREMAKAQQIILPAELRTGDAAPEAIRSAIAEAVAKRIADRRAAAG